MPRFLPPRHGRTHAEGGSDPIPFPPSTVGNVAWIRRYAVNLALAINSDAVGGTTVTWTTNAVEGSIDPDYLDYFTLSSSQITRVDLHGIYEFVIVWRWTGNGQWRSFVNLHDGVGGPDMQVFDPSLTGDFGGYPHARFRLREKANAPISISIGQTSGSSQTLDDVYMESHYVGTYDGIERVDSIWWDQ